MNQSWRDAVVLLVSPAGRILLVSAVSRTPTVILEGVEPVNNTSPGLAASHRTAIIYRLYSPSSVVRIAIPDEVLKR